MNSEFDSPDEADVEQVLAQPFYRSWFINQFGHLRAFWRITFVLIITFALGAVFSRLVSFVPFPEEGKALITWKEFGNRGAVLTAMIFAAFITLRWIDRRPISLLGLNLLRGWKRDFGIGLIIGIGMISITLACLWAGGWMSMSLNDLTLGLLGAISKAFLLFFVAALMEELMLRGYPLQAFIEGSRVWIAVILLSSIFSVMHFNNPDSTIPSSLNIFLAGVLLSVCYLKTRSLWLPTGLHLGWNWMQASFWGMGVSGYHVKWSVFSAEAQGAEWISGGKFGAEASVFATVIISVVAYLIWQTDKLGISKTLETQWSAYPKGYGLKPRSET
jgi:membrane protease YdiL (CAAX protease family)